MAEHGRLIDQSGIASCCVANRSSKTIVCCHPQTAAGQLGQIVQKVRLPPQGRQSFKHETMGRTVAYHCVVTPDRYYICAAEPQVSLSICYNFLAEAQEEDQSAQCDNKKLNSLMVKWNKPGADKLQRARVQVDSIKKIMITNIEKAIDRGEKLDELNTRAEMLNDSALEFRNDAKDLKCKMIREKWKMIAILGGIGLVILIIIIIAIAANMPPPKSQ